MKIEKGCYFSFLGDSITTFDGYLPEGYPAHYSKYRRCETGVFGKEECWWAKVIEHFEGRLLVNNSWSGSYLCKPPRCEIESYACSDARTSALGMADIDPDYILVYIGNNDRGAGFPLMSEDREDLFVMENAYRVMLEKLKRNYPKAEIFCCTFPITTCTRDPDYRFPELYWGRPMAAYGESIKKITAKCVCHIVDLWDENDRCNTADGLHPDAEGMKMIARKVIEAMERQE